MANDLVRRAASLVVIAAFSFAAPAEAAEDHALALVPQLISEFQPKLDPAELAWAQSSATDGIAHGRTPSRAWEYTAAGASMLGHDALAAFSALQACELGWRSDTANNVGVALLHLDRLDDAQLFCDRALEMNPGFAFAMEAEAAIAVARKDPGGAKRWVEKALALRPDDADLQYAGAIVAQESGDAATARARIRKACELRPGDGTFSSAAAAIDPGAAPTQPASAPAADGLARLVAEVNAQLDFLHQRAVESDADTERLWTARGWPIDRTSPPWSQQDLDADIATQRKVVADAEKGFRDYRGAGGYANGKWNFAILQCVLAWIRITEKADQAWWSVDPETRVLAASLHTTSERLYAGLDSGARCAVINPGDGVFCYENLPGGAYAEQLDMEKDHGFGRAFWEARAQEAKEIDACRQLKEGQDACKAAAIQKFCEAIAGHLGGLVSTVQSSVDVATGEFPHAIAAEVVRTKTVTADARDFTQRALSQLRAIGDDKIEAQIKSWTPQAIAAVAEQNFKSYFGGMIQLRKAVLAQCKVNLVEAEGSLGTYVEFARDQVRNCGGGGEFKPRTLSEEVDQLIDAISDAGEFKFSNAVSCDVEMPGATISIKPPLGDSLRPVVDVKLGNENIKVIRGVTGQRRGVALEAAEAKGAAIKTEVALLRVDNGDEEPEYKAEFEGKLGFGAIHDEVGMACWVMGVDAEVNLRELFDNYTEAMRR